MTNRWYILRVNSGSEDLAAEWFTKRLGLDCYYPVAKRFVRPRWRKSKKPIEIDAAVYRGYLFVNVSDGFEWHSVWENPHFREFCFGGPMASVITDGSIYEIKKLEAKGEYIHFNCSDKALMALLKGRIAFVPFELNDEKQSLPAKVVHIVNHVVFMEISILGKAISVNFPIHQIFPELYDNSH